MSTHRQFEEEPIIISIEQKRIHLIGFIIGLIFALLGPIEGTPTVPYLVLVKDSRSNEIILREGPFGLERAEELFASLIDDVKRIGSLELINRIGNG